LYKLKEFLGLGGAKAARVNIHSIWGYLNMNNFFSVPELGNCVSTDELRSKILDYFNNAWDLDDCLMQSVVSRDTFYLNPDPLRNCLIFYLGHTAVFYINKLIQANLIESRIDPEYETLFELGVDPETPLELSATLRAATWPDVEKVWQYRVKARAVITVVIRNTSLDLPIDQNNPFWAVLMGIEHCRVHFETSSMLLRQLPIEQLKRPHEWNYAPINNDASLNEMQLVPGGVVNIGKASTDLIFGWDIEYGHLSVEVPSFLASKYLVTNQEFLEFVVDNGYQQQRYWTDESWQWRQLYNIRHPKFWIPSQNSYRYRAMFDEIELPMSWPVEVNYYEAKAFCTWRGDKVRLMSEAEWQQALSISTDHHLLGNFNINLQFISPSPVGMFKSSRSVGGLADLRGNVWEWVKDTLKPLPGFTPHPFYPDHSALFFDDKHPMMLGGSWATNGSMTESSYRNWFRPYFYQNVGFRVALDLVT
jgi:5-histidylcysteine sulfoxide synthase